MHGQAKVSLYFMRLQKSRKRVVSSQKFLRRALTRAGSTSMNLEGSWRTSLLRREVTWARKTDLEAAPKSFLYESHLDASKGAALSARRLANVQRKKKKEKKQPK